MSQPNAGNGGASGAENGGTSGTPVSGGPSGSEPPAWYNTPPAWMNQQPQNNAGGRSDNSGATRNSDLTSAINSLPDRIIDGIREAFPAPAPSSTPPADAGNAGTPAPAAEPEKTPGQSAGTGGRTKLADWWFGS